VSGSQGKSRAGKLALLTGAAALALCAAQSAQASGFVNQSQSTVYNGSAYAGYAAPGGSSPSAMFLNPVIITQFRAFTTENNFSYVAPNTKISGVGLAGGADSGDIGRNALVPASYAVLPLNSQWFLGVAFNAPFGLATKPDIPWGGQMNSLTTKARTYNLTPSLAYAFSDTLSLGLGVQMQRMDVRFLAAAAPVPGAPAAGIEGDGWGFGVTAGLTWKPLAGTSIGVGYRSRIDQKLEGEYVGALAPFGAISGTLKLPDRLNVSLRQSISRDFDLLASAEWQGWGRIGTAILRGPGVPFAPLQALAFEYDDGWFFALGGEYRWSSALTLRGGLAYEISPISTAIRSTRLPDNDRIWLSAGFSYQMNERFAVNGSFSHVMVKDADIVIAAPQPPYVGSSKSYVNIVSLGVTSKWGSSAASPVVAKY
jgi:long-chain fatty acid transport protein